MNWYKTNLTIEQFESSKIQNKFMEILVKIPRPQKAFLYQKTDLIKKERQVYFELYFTPDCRVFMNSLLIEFNATECEKPNKEYLIGLCIIEDFENMVWTD